MNRNDTNPFDWVPIGVIQHPNGQPCVTLPGNVCVPIPAAEYKKISNYIKRFAIEDQEDCDDKGESKKPEKEGCGEDFDRDYRAKVSAAGRSMLELLAKKTYPGDTRRREYFDQISRLARTAAKADVCTNEELIQLSVEYAWINLMAGMFLDDPKFAAPGGRERSCVQGCRNEQISNTHDACQGQDTSWPCTCCLWPNITFGLCATDCILD